MVRMRNDHVKLEQEITITEISICEEHMKAVLISSLEADDLSSALKAKGN